MTSKRPKPLDKEEFNKRLPPATPEQLLGALHDKAHKDGPVRKIQVPVNKESEYDPETCVTAGELRESGFNVSGRVPDCAWVTRNTFFLDLGSLTLTDEDNGVTNVHWDVYCQQPFRWFEGTYVIAPESHEKAPLSDSKP